MDLKQQTKPTAERRFKSASCPSALQLAAELMGNPVASPRVPSPAQGSRETPKSHRDMEGKDDPARPLLSSTQTEQVGGVYRWPLCKACRPGAGSVVCFGAGAGSGVDGEWSSVVSVSLQSLRTQARV